MFMFFHDRTEAGQRLAGTLAKHHFKDVLILALPRGGVVIGDIIASVLHAPLDLILVRKLPHRFSPEFALGAIAEGSEPLYEDVAPAEEWHKKSLSEAKELIAARRKQYFKDQPSQSAAGKTAIIVDDGIATGLTMKAAVLSARAQKPAKLIVAVPVAAEDSLAMIRPLVDEVIVLDDPANFQGAVGAHYQRFNQVSDDDVVNILQNRRKS
jgi:predicted phosphoribosyltransferase